MLILRLGIKLIKGWFFFFFFALTFFLQKSCESIVWHFFMLCLISTAWAKEGNFWRIIGGIPSVSKGFFYFFFWCFAHSQSSCCIIGHDDSKRVDLFWWPFQVHWLGDTLHFLGKGSFAEWLLCFVLISWRWMLTPVINQQGEAIESVGGSGADPRRMHSWHLIS